MKNTTLRGRGAINLGVSTKKGDLKYRCGTDAQGWSLSIYSGKFYHRNNWSTEAFRFPISPNMRIGMAIDMIKMRIIFFVNGSPIGKYLEGLSEEVFPSVSLGEVGDCVVIVPNPIIPKF
eukprot:TRINITY_DN3621_c0_g1_i2.p2 TRINITY_DN3621_c0_g1~~TRINITY_DN3621_c0_g1_i2.p2  ORF type:complete len:120 (-),score=26.72 TRINITY_DN3621_c0_g1_i2:78-437(-)